MHKRYNYRGCKKCKLKKVKRNGNNHLTPWFDKECLSTKNNIRHLGNQLKEYPDDKNIRTELFIQKKNLQKLVRNKKRLHTQSIINELNNNNNKDQKMFWKLVKELEQNSAHNSQYVSNGNLFNHFKSILNSNRSVNIPPDNYEKGKLDYPFTLEELKKAYSVLKCGKAVGIDNLSNAMIACFTEIYPLLSLKLFLSILDTNIAIPDWTLGMITSIFKKGSKTDPNNYRGISLLSCFGKLFMTLLNNRLLEFAITNKIISPNQLGFLPGNRTSDAHIIIHNLIQKQCHINKKFTAVS